MGISQFFNDAVTMGMALTGQLNIEAPANLRTDQIFGTKLTDRVEGSPLLERAQKARDSGNRTKIGRAFHDAVTLGLVAIGKLKADTSTFRINGAGDLRPTKDTPSLLERARIVRDGPKQ